MALSGHRVRVSPATDHSNAVLVLFAYWSLAETLLVMALLSIGVDCSSRSGRHNGRGSPSWNNTDHVGTVLVWVMKGVRRRCLSCVRTLTGMYTREDRGCRREQIDAGKEIESSV